ncbi:MAG: hypothetical protein WD187_01460 [Candidatus Woykebacteria bacterium]
MNCPVCGSTVTRVSNTYWCPYDRIYVGQNLAVSSPQSAETPQIINQPGPLAKVFDKFLWFLMGVLYLVVIGFVVWSLLSGAFDQTSIFS